MGEIQAGEQMGDGAFFVREGAGDTGEMNRGEEVWLSHGHGHDLLIG